MTLIALSESLCEDESRIVGRAGRPVGFLELTSWRSSEGLKSGGRRGDEGEVRISDRELSQVLLKKQAHVVKSGSASDVDQNGRELATGESEGGVGDPESVQAGKKRKAIKREISGE